MTEDLVVGVIVARHAPSSPWADAYWTPDQILPAAPATPPWTVLGATPSATRYYAGAARLELHRTETSNYLDNLVTGAPKLWVVLREAAGPQGIELVRVTADPSEGEGFTQAGNDIVDSLPMPAEVVAAVQAFCEAHHVERVFEKRQRNRKTPDFSRGGGGDR